MYIQLVTGRPSYQYLRSMLPLVAVLLLAVVLLVVALTHDPMQLISSWPCQQVQHVNNASNLAAAAVAAVVRQQQQHC